LLSWGIDENSDYIDAVYEYLWRYLSLLKNKDIYKEDIVLINDKIMELSTKFFDNVKKENISIMLEQIG
jgi:hypothetical protein